LTGWIEHYAAGMDHGWNYINVRPIVEFKAMSMSEVHAPPPEVEIGETFTLGIKYVDPEGTPITDASVTAMLKGDPTPYPLEHVGSGTYQVDFDTSDWFEGDYTIRVEATATGFTSAVTAFDLEAVEPEQPTQPPPPSFWESYGATVTGVVAVLAVIAIVAVYMYARKS